MTEQNFYKYSIKALKILLDFFSIILQANTNKSLYGCLLQLITTIGPICEKEYINYLDSFSKGYAYTTK